MTVANGQLRLPTRAELRGVNRWAWLFVVLAAVAAFVVLVSRGDFSPAALVSALVAAGAVLVGAALLAVAPGQRLIVASALCFAYRPVVGMIDLAFRADMSDLLRMSSAGYANLAQTVLSIADPLTEVSWLFSLIAILCLAFYVGPVRSRQGWWIVLIGVVLGVLQVGLYFANNLDFWTQESDAGIPDVLPQILQQVANSIFNALTIIAWAYLAAAAIGRGFRFIGYSGLIRLAVVILGMVVGVVAQALPFTSGPNPGLDAFNTVYTAAFLFLDIALFGFLIAGILLELPRTRDRATHTDALAMPATPTEALSPGQ